VGRIIANVRIVKAGALNKNMLTLAFEFLEQPAGRFIIIVINQMEIQFDLLNIQAQQGIQKFSQHIGLLMDRAAD
jgi:hypothetical protein